jgi:hypothetical protein
MFFRFVVYSTLPLVGVVTNNEMPDWNNVVVARHDLYAML